MARLETITDNLANSVTPGYRRAFPLQKTFNQTLTDSKTTENSSAVDFAQGSLRETGNPMDFAIVGDAFFTVGKDNKEYYTRNGHFSLNKNGELVTDSGLKVLGSSGAINIPDDTDTSRLTVDATGTIKAGDQTIGELKLASFADPRTLNKVGSTLFASPNEVKIQKPQDSTVTNRMLEGSNTVIFEEMANLMVCMRNYESCNKILKAQDSKQGEMIQTLG